MESTPTSPCTNVPVICPLCPKTSPAVWKYNLKVHFKIKHPNQSLSEYSHLWEITNFEKKMVEQIWQKRNNPAVRRPKKTTQPSIVVSDAHKSNNSAM
jgi:hypothetical protein